MKWKMETLQYVQERKSVSYCKVLSYERESNILMSNENATPKCTSIFQGYIEYTFIEDFW